LLSVYRREHNLSRHETLRILRHPTDGLVLRRCTGFEDDFPSESGLRYFEKQLTPELHMEINALQIDVLYQAGLLSVKPEVEKKVTLSFDGMLRTVPVRRGPFPYALLERESKLLRTSTPPLPRQGEGKARMRVQPR
jgi:hypothetical protein